jgi:hypothetical protein
MALDDPLRGRIGVALRAHALPGREDRATSHADRITHLAKIVMCVAIHPAHRPSRKRGERGASTLALQALLEGLAVTYADLTGRRPTRTKEKRGCFYDFVEDMVEAAGIPPNDEEEGYNLDYHLQLACRKYKSGKFIFSSK